MKTPQKSIVTLTIQGSIPSFKNNKRAILDSKTGRMRTLTDPKTKKRMQEIIRDLSSQLALACATKDAVTSMDALRRSLIALSPLDDCWQVIPEIVIRAKSPSYQTEIVIEAYD